MSLNKSWHSVGVCEVLLGIFEITNTGSYVYGQLIIFDIWRGRKGSEWIYKTIEGEKKKRKKANIVCFGSKEKRRVELYDNTNVTLDLTSSGLTYISTILDESDSIKKDVALMRSKKHWFKLSMITYRFPVSCNLQTVVHLISCHFDS